MTTQKYVKWDDATPEERILRASKLVETLEGLTLHEQRKHFNMSDWLWKSECGTIGCAAGQCGVRPWFRSRGFKIDLVQDKYSDTGKLIKDSFSTDFPALQTQEFFGDDIDDNIFTNDKFTKQGGGREVYKQVLNAARLYVKKLRAGYACDTLQAAANAAQRLADDASNDMEKTDGDFTLATIQ